MRCSGSIVMGGQHSPPHADYPNQRNPNFMHGIRQLSALVVAA